MDKNILQQNNTRMAEMHFLTSTAGYAAGCEIKRGSKDQREELQFTNIRVRVQPT
jgi:hypothetical protein